MSLNMYLEETAAQTRSMNAICTEVIQAMEDTKTSISTFMFAFTLRGKAYDSAKMFMSMTYSPLAQGIIYLCEELIRQNKAYPSDFASEVSPKDVIELEILDQIREIEQTINRLRDLNDTVPLLSVSIFIYETIKRMLKLKLQKLHTFNISSANNYGIALQLANEVAKGLGELQNGKGFNSASGTFSTDGMDLEWATNIDEIHYKKLAHDQYAEYLEEFPGNINEVVEVIKYEESNPEYVEQTDEFLSPLEEQDIVDIKYLMYTAEEPYRTLAMEYLDRFEIIKLTPEIRKKEKIKANGVFRHWQDAIYVDIEKLRDDDRGNYYTYFHEVAHAFDYYYGQDNEAVLKEMMKDDENKFGKSTFFTDGFKIDEVTLANRMHDDAGANFRVELAKELESSEYEHLSSKDKQQMTDHVTDNLLEQNKLHKTLTSEEKQLQIVIVDLYKDELLLGPDHNTASDVYGGVTNKVIEGSYSHEEDYWLNEDGTRMTEPNQEGFAEYYGRIMSPVGKNKPGIKSIEEFLPSSKQHMDEIFDLMGKE